MTRTRRGRLAAAVLPALVLAAACGGGDDAEEAVGSTTTSTSTTTTTTTTLPPGPVAPLTGVEVRDRPELLEQPAMVVKISNNDDRSLGALIGLELADIVIEERIEDRATRFFAIFHSELPDVVGPVRSGRTSDVDLLAGLGTPIMILSGANGAVMGQLNNLARDGNVVLVVDDARGTWHFRDNDYRRPDNLFSDPTAILDFFGDRAGTPEPIFTYGGAGETRPAGDVGVGVTITGRDIVSFVFVPGEGYVRIQDGAVHVTRDGGRLGVDNLVIMETTYTPSEVVFGVGAVDAVTVGSGAVSVFIGGEVWRGTWERPDRHAGYTFLDADGSEIFLDPGQTWISLAPAGTYDLEVDPDIVGLARAVDG